MPATNESHRQFATIGFSFCVKARNSEWGSSDFTNLLVLKLLIQTWTTLKNQRDLVWKKKNSWWSGNWVSTHLAFVLLDEDVWIKVDMAISRSWQAGLKDTNQMFIIHTPTSSRPPKNTTYSWVSVAAPRLPLPSCHNKLIDKNCHWLCFIFWVLLRGRIPSASYLNWGLLPDLGDQFSVNESGLMDHHVTATALKITSNTFSNTLLNYRLDLQRGGYEWIRVAHQSVCLTKLIKSGQGLLGSGCLPILGGRGNRFGLRGFWSLVEALFDPD